MVEEAEQEKEESRFVEQSKYYIITKPYEVQEICARILKSDPLPILGIDCEGLTKGRPLSLLQVTYTLII